MSHPINYSVHIVLIFCISIKFHFCFVARSKIKLYIGACLKMGIGPVEDLSEMFQVLFGLGEEKKDDKPLQYYA